MKIYYNPIPEKPKKRKKVENKILSEVCEKIQFETKDDAKLFINNKKDDFYSKGKKVSKVPSKPYKCNICNMWHITRNK